MRGFGRYSLVSTKYGLEMSKVQGSHAPMAAGAQSVRPVIIQCQLIPELTGEPTSTPLTGMMQLQLTQPDLDNIAVHRRCVSILREDRHLRRLIVSFCKDLNRATPGSLLAIVVSPKYNT